MVLSGQTASVTDHFCKQESALSTRPPAQTTAVNDLTRAIKKKRKPDSVSDDSAEKRVKE